MAAAKVVSSKALQTLQNVLWYGISTAFTEPWYGLEKVQNQQAEGNAIFIGIQGKLGQDKYRYEVSFNTLRTKIYTL